MRGQDCFKMYHIKVESGLRSLMENSIILIIEYGLIKKKEANP